MVPATAKGEATRAFLLHTAARVFAERGYTGAALTDLITASGLTKGAFYFYFPSKSALALAVLADQQDRWLHRVRDRVLSADTALAQFRALTPSMLDLLTTDPGAWSIPRLTRDMATDPATAEQARTPITTWINLTTDIVTRGQTDGDLRPDLNPHHTAVALIGALDGLKTLTDTLNPTQGSDTFRQQAQTLLAMIEHGLVT
jgi:TetR/AcrR family transcriptional repressor of nem operon